MIMSTESAKVMKRQWHIVRCLLNGNYVATSDIKAHLALLGIDAELRTIQRDLRVLEDIFPIECRDDCMPHSWRWQRLPDTPVQGLSPTQALTLRLVEQQLHDVIPPQLMASLQPLFEKAKIVTGGITFDQAVSHSKLPPSAQGTIKGITHRPNSPFDLLFAEAAALVTDMFKPSEKKRLQQAHQALKQVVALLDESDLADMSHELQSLV